MLLPAVMYLGLYSPLSQGDERLVHRTWDPSGDLGLSLPRAVFPVAILEKVERGHSLTSGRN